MKGHFSEVAAIMGLHASDLIESNIRSRRCLRLKLRVKQAECVSRHFRVASATVNVSCMSLGWEWLAYGVPSSVFFEISGFDQKPTKSIGKNALRRWPLGALFYGVLRTDQSWRISAILLRCTGWQPIRPNAGKMCHGKSRRHHVLIFLFSKVSRIQVVIAFPGKFNINQLQRLL